MPLYDFNLLCSKYLKCKLVYRSVNTASACMYILKKIMYSKKNYLSPLLYVKHFNDYSLKKPYTLWAKINSQVSTT